MMSVYHKWTVLYHLDSDKCNMKLRCFCFTCPDEFSFLLVSTGFNGTDIVPIQSDYPTLGSSTAIPSEGLVTSDLEAHRFSQKRFLAAAHVDLVFMYKVLNHCLLV